MSRFTDERFSIVVKGDFRVAHIECAARGIRVEGIHEPSRKLQPDESVLYVRTRVGQLQRWFGEVYATPLSAGALELFTRRASPMFEVIGQAIYDEATDELWPA